ncbi:MAG: hypothetical protein RLZZ28_103 [Bacteroidota bacterium]
MNLTQEKAFFQLTGKLSLKQVSLDSLLALTKQAPYFAAAHFFLAVKQKQENLATDYAKTIQKTNLFFSSPLWLDYLLNEGYHDIQPVKTSSSASLLQKIGTRNEEAGAAGRIREERATEASDAKIADLLSGQLAEFKKPLDPAEILDIDAEKQRLHTIDYFASQGIKIDLSAIPQDKLTRHLLKFTDWLKQIKSANINPKDLGTSLEMEKAVAETANNSNQTREIITETMAAVLAKQGQTEKAVQLYLKLSFLNPEKSSYFAAKIEQLKGI